MKIFYKLIILILLMIVFVPLNSSVFYFNNNLIILNESKNKIENKKVILAVVVNDVDWIKAIKNTYSHNLKFLLKTFSGEIRVVESWQVNNRLPLILLNLESICLDNYILVISKSERNVSCQKLEQTIMQKNEMKMTMSSAKKIAGSIENNLYRMTFECGEDSGYKCRFRDPVITSQGISFLNEYLTCHEKLKDHNLFSIETVSLINKLPTILIGKINQCRLNEQILFLYNIRESYAY